VVLAEKEIGHEYVELGMEGVHPLRLLGRTPAAHGTPVLDVREDLVLWDSTAIMGWLEAAFPSSRSLLPGTLEERALAYEWVGWSARALYSLHESLFDFSLDAGARDDVGRELVERLTAAAPLFPHASDPELDSDPHWLVPHLFSLADASLAPVLAVLPGRVLADLPSRIQAYALRLAARRSVKEVCADDLPHERPSRAA
jgi:glutathione S-transferase